MKIAVETKTRKSINEEEMNTKKIYKLKIIK